MTSPSYSIVEYDPNWPALFEQEKACVASVLGIDPRHVAHVGSTSVPGLAAKPIVDQMLGIPTMAEAAGYARLLEGIGYEWRGEAVPGTLYLRKAVPRRYNLHVTEYGGAFWVEHLLFRDYLRAHPDVNQEYEELKRKLMATLAADPPAYNEAKTPFIQRTMDRARREFSDEGEDPQGSPRQATNRGRA